MKVIERIVVVLIFMLLPNLDARAIGLTSVFGGSNLSVMGYPDHRCRPPYTKPRKPYSFTSQYEIDSYNRKVETYNFQMREYENCISEYVGNAKRDIKRIQEKTNDAIREANSQ